MYFALLNDPDGNTILLSGDLDAPNETPAPHANDDPTRSSTDQDDGDA